MYEPATSRALDIDVPRLFQALFMRMPDAIALHRLICNDAGAPTNYRIIEVNPQYERLAGRSRDQLVGKLADEAYGEREPPHLALYGEVALEGRPARFDECRAGSGRHYEVSVAAMGSGFFSTLLRDVTDRRLQEMAERSERERNQLERQRLAQQLLHSQRLESLGLLAGGVAHDFNNLLTVILTCTDELMSSLGRDEDSRGLLSEVEQASRRAAELTRQLLAFGRQKMPEPRVLDLNDVVLGVSKMLRRMLGETVDLVTSPGAGVEPVFADPGQLEQIIVNLAINARDAMPAGGRLTLETYNQTAEMACAEGIDLDRRPHVVLAVHDTGIGMDDATRARVFEPFFSTKGERGTGLGLSTVSHIVKQSGGRVAVASRPGSGTTFRIYLPSAGVSVLPVMVAGLGGRRLEGHETVLLVEDEAPVRTALKKVLVAAGYLVIDAANAEEASRKSSERQASVDVLLTDIVLPGASGRQLADWLLGERPSLRVIYMSGYTRQAPWPSAAGEGASAFIQKPIRALQLLSKLREVLDEPLLGHVDYAPLRIHPRGHAV